MHASNLSHQISICLSADPQKMSCIPFESLIDSIETFNLMTYDFASSEWGPCLSRHQTCLWADSGLSVDLAVQYCISRGVPPRKIVIGGALYSRGFANTNGLGLPSHGVVSDKSWDLGVCDYKSLPRPGAVEYWDDQCKATFSFDPQRQILNSYDSVASVIEKANYIRRNGLGGIILWEASGDYPVHHPKSIIKTLSEHL